MTNVINKFKKKFQERQKEEMSLAEYLERAKTDRSLYATPHERLLKAIGEPIIVDTSKDERLGRIHGNKLIKTYAPFAEFYGMETVIEKIVAFLVAASQGLEEAKQILYFLGPVGSAKSSLADKLKQLMEQEPIYVIKGSPIQESPLGLFTKADAKDLGIPERYLGIKASPDLLSRIEANGGEIGEIRVEKIYPSESYQIAIGVVHAGDENTQDVSDLVGKLNIRKLEHFDANTSQCYNYSGGLCRGNRGIMEFVEMFKVTNVNVLNPLLTATQENNYKGTEAIGAIPFEGIIMAHSNESEWDLFKNNKANEAFLDRVNIIKVPYCLRIDEEVDIYKKLLRNSELSETTCAPGTLQMLAEFTILSRLTRSEYSSLYTKVHVYNGEHYKDKDNHAKSLREYKEEAGSDEGFFGVSTREAFKILSKVFNYDYDEIAANPVHMLLVLEDIVPDIAPNEETQTSMIALIKDYLAEEYFELISEHIQTAYIGTYNEYGQSLFDRYILFADQWVQDKEYRDPQTGQLLNKQILNQELGKIEKPAGISNPKDFRHEIVTYVLRYRAKHGHNPKWDEYKKVEDVIKQTMFDKTEDLIPVISFAHHGSEEEQKKHNDFVARMVEKGYTEKQVRLLVEWQMRFNKSKE